MPLLRSGPSRNFKELYLALENAQFLNQLIATNPSDTDPAGQGAAHVRLLKAALLATFPNLNAVVNGTPAQFNSVTSWVSGGGMTIPAPTDATSISNATSASITLSGQASSLSFQIGGTGNNLTLGYAPVPAASSTTSGTSAAPSYSTSVSLNALTGVMNLSGTAPDMQVGGNSVQVPVGSVIMYSGAVASLPSNWNLCDGTNGTPDLRDQFIIGAGKTYTVGQTGGNASITLSTDNLPAHTHAVSDPGHTHTVTLTDPGHTHTVNDPGHTHTLYQNNNITGGTSPTSPLATTGIGPTSQTCDISNAKTGVTLQSAMCGITAAAGSGTTGLTLQATGSGTPITNLPPYYALAFIMRIK